MKDKSILELSDRAVDIQYYLENGLEQVATTWEFTWNTPPHDLARRLMNHIVEFKPLKDDKEGGY